MSVELFTQKDVEAIAVQMVAPLPPVAVVAVQYNWGPPVPGRFEADFLEIWVAAAGERPGEVALHGAREGRWGIEKELAFRSTVMGEEGPLSLYCLTDGIDMPDEFAIELLDREGGRHWDNNGGYGCNYRLTPYRGHGASVIVADQAICRLSAIEPVRLVRRPSAPSEMRWRTGGKRRRRGGTAA